MVRLRKSVAIFAGLALSGCSPESGKPPAIDDGDAGQSPSSQRPAAEQPANLPLVSAKVEIPAAFLDSCYYSHSWPSDNLIRLGNFVDLIEQNPAVSTSWDVGEKGGYIFRFSIEDRVAQTNHSFSLLIENAPEGTFRDPSITTTDCGPNTVWLSRAAKDGQELGKASDLSALEDAHVLEPGQVLALAQPSP
jgi:hypothetical protein